MVLQLHSKDSDFEQKFEALLKLKREQSQDVSQVVRTVIDDVKARGDEALFEYTRKFDNPEWRESELVVTQDEIDHAFRHLDQDVLTALEFAAERITKHHERQRPKNDFYEDDLGAYIGTKWTPIEAVGLYVPGGTASYPSSVLMNAIPAKVAGCQRIAVVTPVPRGPINPAVLIAAHLSGVNEIYRVGGAQAVAALSYGTASIPPVAKIVGPGNAYVAEAKRQVFGQVGIDMVAGPSEVLIVADAKNKPEWIAADLLAQAEHDTAAQSILITDDNDFANMVISEVNHQLEFLSRHAFAQASWKDYGAVIVLNDLNQAPQLVDQLAPEHLELATQDAEAMLERIHNAGSVFLGAYTPEVIGDYVAGTNHVLPTARSARFSSGLGVLDFMKRSSVLRLSEAALRKLGPTAMTLATVEGLDAHHRSVEIRLKHEE